MISLPGYQIFAKIYESTNSIVFRGVRIEDWQPVIVKILKQDYSSPTDAVRYKQEYEITRSLNIDGVIKSLGFQKFHNTFAIIFEDFGAVSLNRLIGGKNFTLERWLAIAIDITQILGEIHAANIIHKDVNPSNIVINSAKNQLKIIDFGISTKLSQETMPLKIPNALEGTLAYLSPEQTGRMNRAVDYRTDFYSLGVTLYELFTQQIPFNITDPMALVHAHLARSPVPPHELKPDIPEMLSEIILKLMAKTAEARYQTAQGLKADLKTSLKQYKENGSGQQFVLARHDVSDRFRLPQKLYGRETEIKTLLAAFEQISQPHSGNAGRQGALMLVSGYSGIGKTSLIQEIHRPITARRGYYISGKFDQFQRNIPYRAFVIAFTNLIQQILTESEPEIEQWRQKLLAALGSNGRIMTEVIPKLALIIGEQPDVTPLPPTEAQNRFNLVLQNFVSVFSRPEHPLVIFLDDLRWADLASLELMRLLIAEARDQYLLFIGAYRDNEVSHTHPLMLMVDEIVKAEATVNQISLRPLNLPDIRQIVADTLHCSLESALPLAELIQTKTQGNPFFINEFLKSLYAEKLLKFDSRAAVWRWDLAKIQAQDITDNVVNLVINKLRTLPAQTQRCLQMAACLGNQFDLNTLAIAIENSQHAIAAALQDAIGAGLVVSLDDHHKMVLMDVADKTSDNQGEYKFTHDRIQQAAYLLIPEERRPAMHLDLGRRLLQAARQAADPLEQNIFDIVNQLNKGQDLLTDQTEKDDIAKLNHLAGQKARDSAAYKPAFNYFETGLRLLGDQGWQQRYDLTLALHADAAEAAYLSSNFTAMEGLTETILERAHTLLDTVRAYEVKILANIVQNRFNEALHTARQILQSLDVHIPSQASDADFIQELSAVNQAQAGRNIEALLELPEMRDPKRLAAMRIMNNVISLIYLAFPQLLPLVILKQVNLSLQYGNARPSAFGYANYGMLLCGALGDIEAGYRFGHLALRLVERFEAREISARVNVMLDVFIRHWKEHLHQTIPAVQKTYTSGLETGDIEFAAYAAFVYGLHSYFGGKSLTTLEPEVARYHDAIKQLKQTTALQMNAILWQSILNLTGQAEAPCDIAGQVYDEAVMIPQHLAANDRNALGDLYVQKQFICYLFEEFEDAVKFSDLAGQNLEVGVSPLVVSIFHFYDSLARLAVYPTVSEAEQAQILERVAANQQKREMWAQHAPMNHLHKFYLVEAERQRVLGNDLEAMEFYDLAIEHAEKEEYTNEEALANEAAARFYLAKGKKKIARIYLEAAHYGYLRWGATRKTKQLEQNYPHLFSSNRDHQWKLSPNVRSTSTDRIMSQALDFSSALKFMRTISSEIVLDKLLNKLIKIVVENSGAEKGCLILKSDDHLLIQAVALTNQDVVQTMQAIPLEESDILAIGIVHYVERTEETLLLDDVSRSEMFSNDSYVQAEQPKSILCLPIISKEILIGILYLENKAIAGAFTQGRLELLKLLTAQVAISLENAILYQQLDKQAAVLENQVTERTAALEKQVFEVERLNKAMVNLLEDLQKSHRQTQLTAEQLTAANSELEAFSYSVSHDLKAPLRAIDGYSRLLLDDHAGQLDKKGQQFLENIRQATRQMHELINDLLEYSRLQRRPIQLSPLDLPRLVNALVTERAEEIQQCGAEVSVNVTCDRLVAEAEGFNQALRNLLDNALKFTQTTAKPQIEIGARPNDNGDCVIWVQDNGIGFAPEYHDRIFEIFQRLHHSEEYQGTGIGLALVSKAAKRMNGRVWAESEPDAGATFYIEIPQSNIPQRQ